MQHRSARTPDVVEKVFAHRSSKKASAFSCPTRDRIDAVDHFISPKSGPRSLPWDFFNNVTRACRVETHLDAWLLFDLSIISEPQTCMRSYAPFPKMPAYSISVLAAEVL